MHFAGLRTCVALVLLVVGCKSTQTGEPRSAATVQNTDPDDFAEQFEATEFAKCIDGEGRSTGTLNFIWRTRYADGRALQPYIVGFSGSARSLKGTLIEFQTLSSAQEEIFFTPPMRSSQPFPRGSYVGFSLLFPHDELALGWSFLKIDTQNVKPADITGAQLLIPKYAIGSGFATRYYFRLEGDSFHEMSCQAINEKTRARLSTFMQKDGSHGFKGERGSRVKLLIPSSSAQRIFAQKAFEKNKPSAAAAAAAELIDIMSTPTPSPSAPAKPTPWQRDLRPIGRPPEYDKIYRHVRLFECGEKGALDAIWRIGNESSAALKEGTSFITGFAGELADRANKNAFYFSSVDIDPSPSFYAGEMPAGSNYNFLTIEFRAEQLKRNNSVHSRLPGLKPEQYAAAGTVFLPRDGSGRGISVSLAKGNSLRAEPYQVTLDCTPVTDQVTHWLRRCIGAESARESREHCSL